MLARLKPVVEKARKEFLKATDPNFIHHRLYTKELPIKNKKGSIYTKLNTIRVGNFKHYEAEYLTDSATFPEDKEHTQKAVMLELMPLVRNKKSELTYAQKVRQAINNGDLLVGCTCEAFLYWGYRFICTRLKVVHPQFKELRPPDIRNPQRRGIICKHLDLVLHVLPFNASKITGDLKKVIKK